MPESVLITGGAGFIGRALVARCLNSNMNVAVLDNLSAGRRENLARFVRHISFTEGDILDADKLDEVMAQVRPNIVFHLAALHFIPFCNAHPRETIRVNVEGTHLVLDAASRYGARVAVLASTGAFYPSQATPLSEETDAVPSDIYGLSKLMAEQVTQYVSANTGMTCVAARLFNTYGPYETNPHLIPEIINGLKNGNGVKLGNIHTKRDYIYVDDVAELLYSCAVTTSEGYTTVNIGTGQEHSAEDIVGVIAGLLKRNITISIENQRRRNNDKLHQLADIRRLESMTGLRPRYALTDGLRQLLLHERLLPSYVPELNRMS